MTPGLQTAPPTSSDNRNLPHRGLPAAGHLQRCAGTLAIARTVLERQPGGAPEFIDLTDDVAAFVAGSGIADGQLTAHSLHTTAAVVINEHEPLLLEDVARWLERLAPRAAYHRHDDLEVRTVNRVENEPANGHAHLRHLMLGGTCQVPVLDGRLALGDWQRLFLVELDHDRPRRVLLQLLGIG